MRRRSAAVRDACCSCRITRSLAQPLDLQTLERQGRPEIVAPEVRYRPWGQASMSVSNDGLLLYRGGTNENHQFTWIGRQGATIATIGPRNRLASSPNYSFNLSPDGSTRRHSSARRSGYGSLDDLGDGLVPGRHSVALHGARRSGRGLLSGVGRKRSRTCLQPRR